MVRLMEIGCQTNDRNIMVKNLLFIFRLKTVPRRSLCLNLYCSWMVEVLGILLKRLRSIVALSVRNACIPSQTPQANLRQTCTQTYTHYYCCHLNGKVSWMSQRYQCIRGALNGYCANMYTHLYVTVTWW